MKRISKTIMTIAAIVAVVATAAPACKQKKYSFQENKDYLNLMGVPDNDLPKKDFETVDTSKVDSIANILRGIGINMTPYKTIKEIQHEFHAIGDSMYSLNSWENRTLWTDILLGRMKFHLANPITFNEWEPSPKHNPLKVLVSPDGKYKFYTTPDICTGTMGEWRTYIQYINSDGKLECTEWDYINVLEIWQFDYNDTTFYVLKSGWQGSSCEYGYTISIATFDNGKPTYHSHLLPESVEKIDFCYTCHALDVDYTFDPNTLSITSTTQDDIKDSCVTKTWRLKTD